MRSRTVTRGSDAEPRMELPVADVDRDDPRRARLEQAVGEARPSTRRRRRSRDPSTSTSERVERVRSFSPPRETKRGGRSTSSSTSLVDLLARLVVARRRDRRARAPAPGCATPRARARQGARRAASSSRGEASWRTRAGGSIAPRDEHARARTRRDAVVVLARRTTSTSARSAARAPSVRGRDRGRRARALRRRGRRRLHPGSRTRRPSP